MKTLTTPRTLTVLVLMLCLAALAAVWLASSTPPNVAASQASAFIQSGGVTSDLPPGMSDPTEPARHAVAPSIRGVTPASMF